MKPVFFGLLSLICFLRLPPPLPAGWLQELNPRDDLTLVYHHDTASPATTMHILLKGGRALEPPQKAGVAYLMHRLMLVIQDPQKQKQVVQWGGRLEFQVREDFSVLTLTCLSEHFAPTLRILADTLAAPPLSGNPVFRAKEAMVYLQKREEDDDQRFLQLALRKVFFAGSGLAASTYGDKTSRKKIKSRDVRHYYQTAFVAANMTIAVSSDLDKETISDIFARHFPVFSAGKPAGQSTLLPIIPEERFRHFPRQRRQALLVTAATTPPLNPSSLVKGILLENLLGGGPGSRLWSLREQKNLAYLVAAQILQLDRGGVIYFYLKTDPQKQRQARREMAALVTRLREDGVGENEFQATKKSSRADFLRRNETKKRCSFTLAYLQAKGLGWRFYEKIPAEIEKTNREEFNTYLRDILHPDRLVEIIIGPQASATTDGRSPASEAGW